MPNNELRPYQHQGVEFLAQRDSALLADEMGLGKTVQTAIALDSALAGGRRRGIVVAPASLKLNWLRELGRWAPQLPARIVQGTAADRQAYYALPVPVLVTSYENLRIDAPRFRSDLVFDVAVLDEAQRIKNPDSSTALGARLIPRRRAWALTGTPLENVPEDLHSVFAYVRPDTIASGMSRTETLEAISPFVLRRRKADVLRELPPIIVQDVPLDLAEAQRRAYDELWRARSGLDGDPRVWTSNALALLTRLKQVCNYEPSSRESVKLEALDLICDGLESDGKLIVFSQFVETLTFIAGQLAYPTIMYHGGLSETERDQNLETFRRAAGPTVLLMSLRAGAVGLNLQEASVVVLFDRWWNPSVEEQAIARAHRFGRAAPLHVFRFLVEDTVERRIEEIIERKRALFADYVEVAAWGGQASAGPADAPRMEEEIPRLKELRELLR